MKKLKLLQVSVFVLFLGTFPGWGQVYVDGSATGASNGMSWSDAYTSLQDALATATGNDEIWIASGTYYPDQGQNQTAGDRNESFTIDGTQDGLKIYGSFVGTENSLADRDLSSGITTVLSGDIGTAQDASDNSYHVIYVDATGSSITNNTEFNGIVVSDGNANDSSTSDDKRGGGLYGKTSSGLECSPFFSNIVFYNNKAIEYGGAIKFFAFNASSSPTFTNSLFVGNKVVNVEDSSRDSNAIDVNVYKGPDGSTLTITNSTFYDNQNINVPISNLIRNSYGNTVVENSVMWGNLKSTVNAFAGTLTVSNSIKDGGNFGTDGGGNLDTDPLFFDPSNPQGVDGIFGTSDDGLILFSNSPAVDAGNNSLNSEIIDITGADRVQDGTVNMGAYEIVKKYFTPFVTTWEVTSDDLSLTIPTGGGEDISDFDFTIDWGDGTTKTITGDDPDPSHTYASEGTYKVSISGTFPHMIHTYNESDNAVKLKTVEQWGDIQWESMSEMFNGAENMTYKATDNPNLQQVTDMSFMFRNAKLFNGDISQWDVSTITNMKYLFDRAEAFNQAIGSWNTSNLTNVTSMFQGAIAFNQNINTNVVNASTEDEYVAWDVSNVEWMENMFDGATSFNQPIDKWQLTGLSGMIGIFAGATAFNQNINTKVINEGTTDEYVAWDISHGPEIYGMFENAKSFNQPLDQWDVSQVDDLDYMFDGATAFNQDLSSWDVSQSAYFNDFLTGTAFSQENYDALLQAWSQLDLVDNMTMSLDAAYSCAAAEARKSIIDNNNWTINDGGSAVDCSAFITTWQTTSANEEITIATVGDSEADLISAGQLTTFPDYNFTINWGDGTTDNFSSDDPEPSHTYSVAGQHQISITGTFPAFIADGGNSEATKLLSIDQWGDIQWFWTVDMFSGATNMTYNANDTPDLSAVQLMSFMFKNASSFNGDIGDWDVSNVIDMREMFKGATSFNGDISNWDVTNVAIMTKMFEGAITFDQPIGNWGSKVANVTDMRDMFKHADSFNQDLNNWDVSTVTDMHGMFEQNIGESPNPLPGSFNGNVSNWDVANVRDMSNMFYGTEFNQDIGNWDVSRVTDMSAMFLASSFNQDISKETMNTGTAEEYVAWDVSNVTSMNLMFAATPFNQDISGWTVDSVTDMSGMFFFNTVFDQDLSNWNVANVQSFTGEGFAFMSGSLSTENYDALLEGWSQLTLQNGVTLGVDDVAYSCAAVEARKSIIDNNNWTINDGGLAEDNLAPTVLTQDIKVELDENGEASITADQIDDGSIDNCGIESLALNATAFDCSSEGENTVTLTVTDSSGNEATETATVTVEDNLAPTVSTQDITVQLDENGQVSITADQIDAGSSDNCGIESIALDITDFTNTDVGENTVTLTLTDVNGNVATAEATVTVEDSTLSLGEFEKAQVSLYPNPATSQITIEATGVKIAKVSIYDLTGKLVKTSPNSLINVSELSSGVYLVSLTDDTGRRMTRKLIKD